MTSSMSGNAHTIIHFSDGLRLSGDQVQGYCLQTENSSLPLKHLSHGICLAFEMLSGRQASIKEVFKAVLQTDGPRGSLRLAGVLEKLHKKGLINCTLICQQRKLFTVIPGESHQSLLFSEPVLDDLLVLSRFAYLRREESLFILQSPLSSATIVFHDSRILTLIHLLAAPRYFEEVLAFDLGLSPEIASTAVQILNRYGFICPKNQEEQPSFKQWEFHDLLFHTRSRIGRYSENSGATFRFLNTLCPAPPIKSHESSHFIRLYKPDLEKLKSHDLPFTHVLEQRRSIRIHGDPPISLKQMGEFLFRSARIRKFPAETEGIQDVYGRSDRPYPGAGACYELEIYIVAGQCLALPPGLYHYCPLTHCLFSLTTHSPSVDALLQDASSATGEASLPQMLIVITARFQRMTWKYEGMAYAAILKDVGVLYQTMYLVASAMGLAACAIGNGNSDLFCRAVESNYYEETSVGEFILGTQ